MRKLLLIGRWFRGRNKVVVDLQAYRELKKKREERVGSQGSGVRGQESVAPGEAWSVGIGGDRAALEIRYWSLMGSNPIR